MDGLGMSATAGLIARCGASGTINTRGWTMDAVVWAATLDCIGALESRVRALEEQLAGTDTVDTEATSLYRTARQASATQTEMTD